MTQIAMQRRTDAHCRSCGSTELSSLSVPGQPAAVGRFPGAAASSSITSRVIRWTWRSARNCSLVQILETVPPEELFGADYPYFSSFTDTLLQHSEANVKERIAERKLGSDSLVVELASNDGYLLQYYKAARRSGVGHRPRAGPGAGRAREGNRHAAGLLRQRAGARTSPPKGRRADVIHANNVLAHVADTNGFVAGIATLLKDDGVAVIECPYVKDLIEHGEFDTIYHEHLCYFSVTALRALFSAMGCTSPASCRCRSMAARCACSWRSRTGPEQSVLRLHRVGAAPRPRPSRLLRRLLQPGEPDPHGAE